MRNTNADHLPHPLPFLLINITPHYSGIHVVESVLQPAQSFQCAVCGIRRQPYFPKFSAKPDTSRRISIFVGFGCARLHPFKFVCSQMCNTSAQWRYTWCIFPNLSVVRLFQKLNLFEMLCVLAVTETDTKTHSDAFCILINVIKSNSQN